VHGRVWWGNLRERDRLDGLGVDGNVILKRVLEKGSLCSDMFVVSS
jgi:hypothetical protein